MIRPLLFTLLVLAACGRSSPKATLPGVADHHDGRDTLPRRDIPADATVHTTTNDDLSWLAPVHFDVDSSELRPQTRDTLAKLGTWLAAHPKAQLRIEGHCDETGTTEYNIGLGQRRAQAIADFLVRLGTSGSQLAVVSYGSEQPVAEGHDEVAYAQNRRGELKPDAP